MDSTCLEPSNTCSKAAPDTIGAQRYRVTILSWDIQQGGGSRVPRIIDALVYHDPDVIALSEFRTMPGAEICSALASRGWQHIESTNPTGADNGLCVLSRTPMVRAPLCLCLAENRFRWLDVSFPEHGFATTFLHVLCSVPKVKDGRPGEAKTRFWNSILEAAEARLHEPYLLVGDFNTGAHAVDEVGRTFVCANHFVTLSVLGWTDAWRQCNPGTTEWTWYSRFRGGARGNGFRLDHAFASPTLKSRIVGCRYSHAKRQAGISDHSMLIVEIE